ncbi:uncharacterized protein LOC144700663 isoform X2 [Wolffia australiana]
MESEIALRRMRRIADHVAPSLEVVDHPPNQISPVNCSSMMRYGNPRRDNRMFFSRQGSASQGRFMRQVSIAQHSGGEPMLSRPFTPVDNPLFAKFRQAIAEVNVENSPEPPNFARPCSGKTLVPFNQIDDRLAPYETPPRTDIAESALCHIVTVELPGANIVDIKVEVDDKNLTVTGKYSYPRWKTEIPNACAGIVYHQREILQGPYKLIWPLPSNVNRDSVSAELLSGFLRIILPKVFE